MSQQKRNDLSPKHAPKVMEVLISLMETPPALVTQRPFIQAHGDALAKDLDLGLLGYPVINHREGKWWIVDGQHRIYALKENGFANEKLYCEVYTDLSDQEMAQTFLGRDRRRAISPFVKFKIGVTAGQSRETAILRVVEANGLSVTRSKGAHNVGAVSTLIRIYDSNPDKDAAVGFVLRVAKHAFTGDALGFDAAMLEALGLIHSRYSARVIEKVLIERLSLPQNSARNLMRRVEDIRTRTGNYKAPCLASVIVDAYNKNAFGKQRLQSWWKMSETDAV